MKVILEPINTGSRGHANYSLRARLRLQAGAPRAPADRIVLYLAKRGAAVKAEKGKAGTRALRKEPRRGEQDKVIA